MTKTDSGYTEAQISTLLAPFMVKAAGWAEENLSTAMVIGLADGDLVELSERGTVLLETPREELDRRMAAIKEKMAAGMTQDAAIEAVVG